MQSIKLIITHVLNGFVQLAQLFDKSVTSLISELDSTTEADKPTRKTK